MLFENFKIALRIIYRHKIYSAINILGLSVGIAATVLILHYVRFELSYDDFHPDSENIYRTSVSSYKEGTLTGESSVFTPPLGPAMKDEFPEVAAYTRISTPRTFFASVENEAFRLENTIYADSTFFGMFAFTLSAGDPSHALSAPFSMVLTEEKSSAMCGTANPIGKTVRVNNRDLYTITGVVKNPPANSHIRFNALISFSTLYTDTTLYLDWDGGNQYISYVRLVAGRRPADVESRLPKFMWNHINNELAAFNVRYDAHLQPLGRIHLYEDPGSANTRANIIVLSIVAAFILFVACVNYVNLSVAGAFRRGKEVGIRKVLGANRGMIVRQFLAESVLMTLISSFVALLIAELTLPLYADLLPGGPSHSALFQPGGIVWVAVVVAFAGIAAGGYPALHLSSPRPAETLRGGPAGGHRKGFLRNILLTLQFAVSIALIACTIVIIRQVRFMNDRNPGFDRDNVLVMPLIGNDVKSRSTLLSDEFRRIAGVTGVTASSEVPVGGFTSNGYFPEGHKSPMMIHVVDVDEHFLDTYGITLFEGRGFTPGEGSGTDGFLINETLARTLEWKNPVGRTIRRNGDHPVIGVVKDFNFASLHAPVGPLILTHRPWRGLYDILSVRISPERVGTTLQEIRDAWARIVPSAPPYYWFLDDLAVSQYDGESRFGTLFLVFSGLSIWIALMGLVSLASYVTEQRTKEIGVRKILGATVPAIVLLLGRDFLKWIVLANVIAWPVAYYFLGEWLLDFAYRVQVGPWPFLLAGLTPLFLGWLIVSAQTIRAATTNPARTLRYE